MISMRLKVLIITVVLAVVMTRKISKPTLNITLPANETPYIWDFILDIGKLMKYIQT